MYYDKERNICEGFSVPDSQDIRSTRKIEDVLSQGEKEDKALRATSIPEKGQNMYLELLML